jgi:hypothetical protein
LDGTEAPSGGPPDIDSRPAMLNEHDHRISQGVFIEPRDALEGWASTTPGRTSLDAMFAVDHQQAKYLAHLSVRGGTCTDRTCLTEFLIAS